MQDKADLLSTELSYLPMLMYLGAEEDGYPIDCSL